MLKRGFLLIVYVVGCVLSVDADYRNDGFNFRGFLPSSSFQRTEDQLAEPSSRVDSNHDEAARVEREDKDRENRGDRTQRFGISYGNGNGEGFAGSAPGAYGPIKIDLGGVLLGSILGFGAVLVLPKIMHILSYGGYGGYHGGFARSVDSNVLDVSDMLGKLDETLTRYNIDSASCMQRLACSYVQLADDNMINGNGTDFDALLSTLSSNSLIRRMLDGTSVLDAITAGKASDTDCQQKYPKCKLEKKTVIKMITQLVP